MGMETAKGTYEKDERRTQATLLDNAGTMGGKLDVFRGVRDMEDQIIVHLREYNSNYCANDHLRFSIDEAKEHISNLDAVSANSQVFIMDKDASKSRPYVACVTPEGRLLASSDVSGAAQQQFQVDVDWSEFKKAVTKAARRPRAKKS